MEVDWLGCCEKRWLKLKWRHLLPPNAFLKALELPLSVVDRLKQIIDHLD